MTNSQQVEFWMPVKDFPNYEVSDKGRVRSGKSITGAGRVLKLAMPGGRYLAAILRKKTMLVHRLVAKAFISNPSGKPYVNHKDGDKRNNLPNNLEWVTPSENGQHASLNGLLGDQRGTKNPSAKLSEDDVLDIRNLNLAGVMKKDIAEAYSMSRAMITHVCNRHSWKHI